MNHARLGLADLSAVLGVVVDEHVVGVGGHAFGQVGARRNGDLKAAHVPRVTRIFQAVLIAL